MGPRRPLGDCRGNSSSGAGVVRSVAGCVAGGTAFQISRLAHWPVRRPWSTSAVGPPSPYPCSLPDHPCWGGYNPEFRLPTGSTARVFGPPVGSVPSFFGVEVPESSVSLSDSPPWWAPEVIELEREVSTPRHPFLLPLESTVESRVPGRPHRPVDLQSPPRELTSSLPGSPGSGVGRSCEPGES